MAMDSLCQLKLSWESLQSSNQSTQIFIWISILNLWISSHSYKNILFEIQKLAKILIFYLRANCIYWFWWLWNEWYLNFNFYFIWKSLLEFKNWLEWKCFNFMSIYPKFDFVSYKSSYCVFLPSSKVSCIHWLLLHCFNLNANISWVILMRKWINDSILLELPPKIYKALISSQICWNIHEYIETLIDYMIKGEKISNVWS